MLSNEVYKEFFESVIENNTDAIFILSADKEIIQINNMATSLLGYSLEDLKAIRYSEIIVQEQLEKYNQHFYEVLNGFPKEDNLKVYHKNGEIIRLRVKSIPLIFQNETVMIFCKATEITNLYRMKKFKQIFNSLSDAIGIFDLDGNVIEVNQEFETLYGWKKEEIKGKQLPFIPKGQLDNSKALMEKIKTGESIREFEVSHMRKDGTIIDISMTVSPVRENNEEVVAFSVISRNITKLKKLHTDLKDSEERYRFLADNTLDLVQLVNCGGIITYASPSHKTILGYSAEEYIGKKVYIRPNMREDESFKKVFSSMVNNKKAFTYEIVREHIEGHKVWIEVKGTPMFDNDGRFKNMMLIGREITERKEFEKHLEYLSYYDALTDIPNRRLLKKRIEKMIIESNRYSHKFAVLFIDMDRFKYINDTFGHDVGDELLKQFASRIKGHLREADTLARQGGDEFIILLSQLQEEKDALVVAERILTTVQEPWKINEHIFHTSSSIGIAFYPEDGITRHELMKHADNALYEAKENGRNNYKVYSSN